MKTKAAVLYKTGSPLRIEELKIPPLKKGQVLVKILYSGLCHTQLNEIDGTKGKDIYLPHTLGHEASGIVEAIGEGVTKVEKGDYVVASWIKGSGIDAPSSNYKDSMGNIINSGAITTFLEHSIISENRLNEVSKAIPPDIAALFGCALFTGGGIIQGIGMQVPKKTLAIFGIGGIGASALLIALSSNYFSKIIAVDLDKKKLEYARELGATHIVDASKKNVVKRIKSLTKGLGVDYCIEVAGSKKAMQEGFESLRDGESGEGGGELILAGNIPKGEVIELYPFDLIKGKRIRGSWGGETSPDRDITLYEHLHLSNLPIRKLITEVYPFEKINEAIENFRKGKGLRTLIKMNEI